MVKYIHVNLALYLLVSFAAFIHEKNEFNFWQFNRALFLRFLLSLLYTGVFYFVITIPLSTIETPFLIDIRSELCRKVGLISLFILHTWHFLAGVPQLSSLKNDSSYPKSRYFFIQYLLIPLLSLYMIILYRHMINILITQIWSQGYVGWSVSILSALGVCNLPLLNPAKNKSEKKWIELYSKCYYVLILPLLLMLFFAVGKRVSEYRFPNMDSLRNGIF